MSTHILNPKFVDESEFLAEMLFAESLSDESGKRGSVLFDVSWPGRFNLEPTSFFGRFGKLFQVEGISAAASKLPVGGASARLRDQKRLGR